ncbi:hypothetical protein IFM89_004117 [Coptis chinensis]|uniref:RRM domain-containing protein n=1 Tax=Coptis chinensis TaxID=261450 RepID=A0A835H1R8_9MAGN|nr:hypothetical protein IFM89_004117 [Coptis chinensis]
MKQLTAQQSSTKRLQILSKIPRKTKEKKKPAKRMDDEWRRSITKRQHGRLPPTSNYNHHNYQPTTLEEIRTLWIGDLQSWVKKITSILALLTFGEVMSIKIIPNKITQQPEGYGFVEFASHGAAERVLQTYNDTLMPGTDQPFRLNWASFGIGERCPDVGPEHSIFVGDLASDVTDYLLQKTFRAQHPSVRCAKVVTNPNTGRSKGYGFVKFSDEMERNRAMSEMNGVYCSKRANRAPKKALGFQEPLSCTESLCLRDPVYPTPAFNTAVVQPFPAIDNDITNTTAIKEVAIQRLNGTMIGQQTVRLSWGRSMTAKQPGVWAQPSDPHQWNGAYYGYGQGYDAYGYMRDMGGILNRQDIANT